ncbi:hypothetical protein DID78_00370 [Candidatus Marinamargulisbacteria bacterium SCGC AG-343-D04]|nr:hypothetical protein DID78_00370 [Candidatus Marinamargulisbacteria bacterium SCGC AG-343-D04]
MSYNNFQLTVKEAYVDCIALSSEHQSLVLNAKEKINQQRRDLMDHMQTLTDQLNLLEYSESFRQQYDSQVDSVLRRDDISQRDLDVLCNARLKLKETVTLLLDEEGSV